MVDEDSTKLSSYFLSEVCDHPLLFSNTCSCWQTKPFEVQPLTQSTSETSCSSSSFGCSCDYNIAGRNVLGTRRKSCGRRFSRQRRYTRCLQSNPPGKKKRSKYDFLEGSGMKRLFRILLDFPDRRVAFAGNRWSLPPQYAASIYEVSK